MTKLDGSPWDTGGDATAAPDLFVAAYLDGSHIGTTTTENDRYTAFYFDPFTLDIAGVSRLQLLVFDADLTSDDPAYSCDTNPLTIAHLRRRDLVCETAGYSLAFTLSP